MWKILRYASLLFLVTQGLWSQTRIAGRIVDAGNGHGIYNVQVIVEDSDVGTTTDKDGHFELSVFQEYPLTLHIKHIAYEEEQIRLAVSRDLEIRLVPRILEIDQIDVSDVRIPGHTDVSSPNNQMDSADLMVRSVQDFQEVTRTLSSVAVEGGFDGSQTVSIRGSNSNEIPVYLDGVRINDAFTNIADLSQVDMQDVSSIEIIKGAATLPYEVGAFGGVINIYSNPPEGRQIRLRGGLDLNNDQNLNQAAHLNYRLGRLGMAAQLTHRSRNLIENAVADARFNSLLLNWQTRGGSFRLKALYQHSLIGNDQTGFSLETMDNQLWTARYMGRLPWLGAGWQIEGSTGRASIGTSFWSLGTSNPLYRQDPKGKSYEIRIARQFTSPTFEGLLQYTQQSQIYEGQAYTAIQPEDWEHPSFEKDVWLNLDRQDRSATGIFKYLIDTGIPGVSRMNVEYGIRYDEIGTIHDRREEWRYFEEDQILPIRMTHPEDVRKTRPDHFTSRRLGMRFEGRTARTRYSAFLSQGDNNRLPTLQDIFYKNTQTVVIRQEEELVQEIVNTTDISLEIDHKPLQSAFFKQMDWKFDLFENGYINKLGYFYTVAQPPIPYNRLDAELWGIEVAGQFHMHEDRGWMDLGFSYLSLSDPIVFLGKSSLRGTLGMTLKHEPWTWYAGIWSDGRRYLPGQKPTLQDARGNIDLTLTYDLDLRHMELNWIFSVKNILNYDETEASDYFYSDYYLLTVYDQFQAMLSLNLILS